MTEARTERLQPTLHGKTIGSTIKTSRKEKKLVKDNEASDWLVFLMVSLSARPRQNSSLLPFHETHAWSAAVLHALYHYSDETGPFTQSKKGFWGIWQANFGSIWHASRQWQRGQAIQNSNGCQETGRGRHFSKRPGPQFAWQMWRHTQPHTGQRTHQLCRCFKKAVQNADCTLFNQPGGKPVSWDWTVRRQNSCFRVGSCWVFIANTFFSPHQQSVLCLATLTAGVVRKKYKAEYLWTPYTHLYASDLFLTYQLTMALYVETS